MRAPSIPATEADRLCALEAFAILDTPADAAFDALTQLAAHIADAPIALVSLVDANRQWFKSRQGLDATETPREVSFCGHVVASGHTMVVPDALEDERFADNPLVLGPPNVRFYCGVPLRMADGHVLGTLCVIDHKPRSMSDSQKAMLELLARRVVDQLEAHRDSMELDAERALLRGMLVGMAEGAIQQGVGGAFVVCNPAAEQITGLTLKQLRGIDARPAGWRCVDREGLPVAFDALPGTRVLQTGAPVQGVTLGFHKGGGRFSWASINAVPLRSAATGPITGSVSTFNDVTERIAMEQALADERAFLTTSLDLMPNASLVIYDVELAVLSHFGSPFVGRPDAPIRSHISQGVPVDCREAVEDAARGALRGDVRHSKFSMLDRRYELTCVPFPEPGRTGTPRGVALLYDVTERDQLRERMIRQDRLATTGTLAAGVGHEINNPLTYVTGNIDYAMDELRHIAGGSPSGRLLELVTVLGEAREGAERIRKIVRGLRAFARDEGVSAPTDISAAVEVSLNMAMHEVRQRASVSLTLGQVPLALADESRIAQVFVNVIVNAAQAFLTRDLARNRIDVETYLAPDGRVAVRIRDNGPGIPAHLLARVFDPFFTTKPVGEGTGLGLAISQGIVASLGGEVICESVVGEGTCFTILLQPSNTAVLDEGAILSRRPLRRGRVLVVDDDDALLNTVTRCLDRDHDVVALSDPRAALSLLEGGERYSLVLCDLAMPHMSGIDLYRRVHAISTDQAERFVFMSSGSTDPEVRLFLETSPNERLGKPFQLQNLRGIARRMTAPNTPSPAVS
jgi:PAS domain S-box-containing protein